MARDHGDPGSRKKKKRTAARRGCGILPPSLTWKGRQGLDLVLTTYGKLIALVALAVATPLSLLVKLTGLLWRRK